MKIIPHQAETVLHHKEGTLLRWSMDCFFSLGKGYERKRPRLCSKTLTKR